MMKLREDLNDNNKKEEKSEILASLIEFLFGAIIAAVIVIFLFGFFTRANITSKEKFDPVYVTITDIYKENDSYYMTVDTEDNLTYNFEISKYDFIKYKEADVIKVTIKNGNVVIVK